MICPKCGHRCPDFVNFCVNCGESLEAEKNRQASQQEPQQAFQQENWQEFQQEEAPIFRDHSDQSDPVQRDPEQRGYEQRGYDQSGPTSESQGQDNPFRTYYSQEKGFVEPDEMEILSWGGAYVNFFTVSVNHPTCILTDKRVYFTGNVYTSSQTMKEKMVIDLKDINGVGFSWISFSLLYKLIPFVFMILSTMTAVAFGMYGHNLRDEISAPITLAVISLIIFILFCILKRKAFRIDYMGNSLIFLIPGGLQFFSQMQYEILRAKKALIEKEAADS